MFLLGSILLFGAVMAGLVVLSHLMIWLGTSVVSSY